MKKSDFEGIMEGLSEAVAHARGDVDLPEANIHIPREYDTRAIRKALGLSQAAFAARFRFSLGAVRDWEQGRKTPDASTRAYLQVIAHEPEAVSRALEHA
jgi:putative transcriptional regulator